MHSKIELAMLRTVEGITEWLGQTYCTVQEEMLLVSVWHV
jgi:hypothetical protein